MKRTKFVGRKMIKLMLLQISKSFNFRYRCEHVYGVKLLYCILCFDVQGSVVCFERVLLFACRILVGAHRERTKRVL